MSPVLQNQNQKRAGAIVQKYAWQSENRKLPKTWLSEYVLLKEMNCT